MKNINFEKKILLSKYTTIKVGGFAEYFSKPNNSDEFINVIKWSHLNKQKCRIIGAGSNLLINNIFLKGLTICTRKMRSIKIESHSGIVMAEAGVMLQKMSNMLLNEGIYVVGFFFPVVPKGQARIRVQISAAHEKKHLDQAINAFIKVGKELKIIN